MSDSKLDLLQGTLDLMVPANTWPPWDHNMGTA